MSVNGYKWWTHGSLVRWDPWLIEFPDSETFDDREVENRPVCHFVSGGFCTPGGTNIDVENQFLLFEKWSTNGGFSKCRLS